MTIAPEILRAEATGSSAAKWVNCAASVAMEHGIIEPEKKYAAYGTDQHKQVANILLGNAKIDSTTTEDVRVCVETVYRFFNGRNLRVEQRLPFLRSSGGIDVYEITGKQAIVADYKFGVGYEVKLPGYQLPFYACCLKEKYPQITKVLCIVIQPRIEGIFAEPLVSTCILDWRDLKKWRKTFEDALIEVEKAEKLKAGSWCKFCKARGGCPAYIIHAEAAKLGQEAFDTFLPAPAPEILPAEYIPRVSQLLRMRKQVESWFSKAEEWLLFHAQNGREIPGFELARKKTRRQWLSILPEDEVAQELQKRGIDPWKKSLIPFTAAEKIADIDDLLEKPEGGWTLKERK